MKYFGGKNIETKTEKKYLVGFYVLRTPPYKIKNFIMSSQHSRQSIVDKVTNFEK